MSITSANTTRNKTGHQGIYDSILEAMGNTPLVRLHKVSRGVQPQVLAKVEFFNPGGSVKDRIGLAIIEDAERTGKLKPGGTIVESTSGNTGVGLAIVAAIRGYKTVFVMPDKMSDEKIRLLRAFGARVVITPTAVEPDDPRSYYSVARRIAEQTPNAILANQYHNPINPQVHYETTGPEIWEQTEGKVDVYVATMGTGGTISGTARYLKEQNPNIQIVGVDPIGSLLYHYFYHREMTQAHPYRIEGFGEDFLPSTLDFDVIDDVVQVNDRESMLMTRRLVQEEGIFGGGSAGSAVVGALRYIQQKNLGPDKNVVVLLPDSGSRYLSKIFNDDWMRENGFFAQSGCEDATALDVLGAKPRTEVITVTTTDSLMNVIGLMKAKGISQAPVVHEGQLVGIVREVDILNHMLLASHTHSADEAIGDIVQSKMATVGPDAPLDALMSLLVSGEDVVLVVPPTNQNGHGGQEILGILTKIDVLDYVATHCM
ncbi:MAG: cystathionine beta-synthase [Chloroflexi bacterium]|nr:cystathionine beta-synthase [Chloroflexota bacterium]